MEKLGWVEIVFGGAFGIGFLKLLWDIYQWVIGRLDKKQNELNTFKKNQLLIEELFNDLISNSVRIQELMEEFTEDVGVLGATIFKLENGGGMPQLGTVQHISILYEVLNSNYKLMTGKNPQLLKSDFQNFIIDGDYQKMLLKMLSTNSSISEKDSNEVSIIKNIHKSMGIEKCLISPITHIPEISDKLRKGFLLYIDVHLHTNSILDSEFYMKFDILKNKIREIYQDFYVKKIKNFS